MHVVFFGHVTASYAVPAVLQTTPAVSEVHVPTPGVQGASISRTHAPAEQTWPAAHSTASHPEPSEGQTRAKVALTQSCVFGGQVGPASGAAHTPFVHVSPAAHATPIHAPPPGGQTSAMVELRHCLAFGVQPVAASFAEQIPFRHASPAAHAVGTHSPLAEHTSLTPDDAHWSVLGVQVVEAASL
jgi:hypothetical protein